MVFRRSAFTPPGSAALAALPGLVSLRRLQWHDFDRTGDPDGVRAEMRQDFPRRQYARRALVETVFSTVKRKLSARAPGRSLFMQLRQALLLGLAYNLYRL